MPAGTAFDLFRGTAASVRDEVEAYPTQLAGKVTFGAKTHPEVRLVIITGGHDGRCMPDQQFCTLMPHILLFCRSVCRNPQCIDIAVTHTYMLASCAVVCCVVVQVAVFSPDGTMLVTGSTDGFIEVRLSLLITPSAPITSTPSLTPIMRM